MAGSTVYDLPPEAKAQVRMHDLRDPVFAHDNLIASSCACRQPGSAPKNGVEPVRLSTAYDEAYAPPQPQQPKRFGAQEGKVCANCGGSRFRQTGTCHACEDCGNSEGCG